MSSHLSKTTRKPFVGTAEPIKNPNLSLLKRDLRMAGAADTASWLDTLKDDLRYELMPSFRNTNVGLSVFEAPGFEPLMSLDMGVVRLNGYNVPLCITYNPKNGRRTAIMLNGRSFTPNVPFIERVLISAEKRNGEWASGEFFDKVGDILGLQLSQALEDKIAELQDALASKFGEIDLPVGKVDPAPRPS